MKILLQTLFFVLLVTQICFGQWVQTNGPYGGESISCFAVSGTNLFAGTGGSGVWRRPLSEMITAVEDNKNTLPINYSLSQNYPNPFNPSTAISFTIGTGQLSAYSHATLKVYDVLGNEVATLVNEEKSAGTYEVKCNAGYLSSGVYFYQLKKIVYTNREISID